MTDLGYEEQQRRTDDSLKSLADAFDGGWGAATVEAESDDYFVSGVGGMSVQRGRLAEVPLEDEEGRLSLYGLSEIHSRWKCLGSQLKGNA